MSPNVPQVVREAHRPRHRLVDDATPVPGQIWRVVAPGWGVRRLVLLIEVDVVMGMFTAMLISPQVDMATSRDAILSESESPLGYALIVETWNQFPILPSQLVTCYGPLAVDLFDAIRQMGAAPDVLVNLRVGLPLWYGGAQRTEFRLIETEAAKELSRAAFAAACKGEKFHDR